MKTVRQWWWWGDECVQALHSSGCLKGKAKPLSMAAILMQDSEQLSGHSASCDERRLFRDVAIAAWTLGDG